MSVKVYDSTTWSWVGGEPARTSVAQSRRFAMAAPYAYIGTAPSGTLESAAAWTIVREDFTGAVAIATATSTAWTNRATATYA